LGVPAVRRGAGPESAIRLWEEGYPVRFGISIEAVVDKREATAMLRRRAPLPKII